jgi:hypothetical protein
MLDNPQLDEKTYSCEAGSMATVYTLQAEEKLLPLQPIFFD